MHELAICEALMQQLRALASRHGASEIRRVTVQVGELSGVEGSLLAAAFSIARAGSCAQHAELIVEPLAVRIRCRRCGTEAQAAASRLCCGACGAPDTQLLSGDELLLRQVEMTTSEEDYACATAAAAH